ncbi:transporter substrate-binding domain-containing protein [Yoonia sp. SS1-5]|uniref:Transporter substrate-binding domain-containing protein n=1 Tax=Yoonia rhodophyticola TaxID=3137370 RepID=A0AAN0NIP0_9RHOB
MFRSLLLAIMLWCGLSLGGPVLAQEPEGIDRELTVATVTRAPFSMVEDGKDVGFSIALWEKLASEINLSYRFVRYETFSEMIAAVENGDADAAIANISITEDRETRMDFTQPIFETGLQIMLRGEGNGTLSLIKSILSPRLLLAVLFFLAVTLGIGMLMWYFERRKQDMFGKTARDAAFPAFWWALNVIISSAHEEETPKSPMGRVFGTIMLICSLFLISFFTANITAALTLNAISEDVSNISDLDGRRVGTTAGSTTSSYLDLRGIQHRQYDTLDALLQAFETDSIDAVVFDGPILAYYLRTTQPEDVRLIERFFRREGYGIALPTGSVLREPLDRALLNARENGAYDELRAAWFGAAYSND